MPLRVASSALLPAPRVQSGSKFAAASADWSRRPSLATVLKMGSGASNQLKGCEFCGIVQGGAVTRCIYEDDELMGIEDISPAAAKHLLILPKRHIGTVFDLCRHDAPLVEQMLDIGVRLIKEAAPESESKFGFHYPPYNSVNHLHLHCFALPHQGWKRLKYIVTPYACGGFITAKQLLDRLSTHGSFTGRM